MGKFLILTAFLAGFYHPMHISVCEIDLDAKRNALEITQRIFLDDLELELTKEMGSEKIVLTDIADSKKRDALIKPYLERHIKISLDGTNKAFAYLGHEIENDDVVFCYFEIKGVLEVNQIMVLNDILVNVYDDQVNIVHVSQGDKVKSMKLWKEEFQSEISF